ncbi:MAG: peptide deformylase [Actinomycetota bacterium]
MAVRPVLRIPHPGLKAAAPAGSSASEGALATDLVDTMRASPACVGLAAPQIGVARRAFVVDVTGHPKATACHGLIVVFEPVAITAAGRAIGREGCLSVPDFTADVARATQIVVRGLGVAGEEVVVAAEGFEARALQHEIDHLDGLLILDRVASLATDVFRRRIYGSRS